MVVSVPLHYDSDLEPAFAEGEGVGPSPAHRTLGHSPPARPRPRSLDVELLDPALDIDRAVPETSVGRWATPAVVAGLKLGEQ